MQSLCLPHTTIVARPIRGAIKMLELRPNSVCWQAIRLYNRRIAEIAQTKLKRKLRETSKRISEVRDVQMEPPRLTVKKNISHAIETIEGKDVLRTKREVLNKMYLESISEIISLHKNYEKLPRLNINNIEVNDRLLHVRIYWNFTEENPALIEDYNRLLNEMIPDIKKNLATTYYRNRPPELSFVYDVYDGINSQMEYLFSTAKRETSQWTKEPFDPSKLFEKEKLIKKEFDIKSVVVRDPSVDFPRDEENPTRFRHPYEMNLFMCKLDFKRMYESILFQLSQGKGKRTLRRTKPLHQTSLPSVYVEAPVFRQSDLQEGEYEMPLTDDRVKLMRSFVIANKKKFQRESREQNREMFDRLDDELEEKLSIKRDLEERYSEADSG